MLAALDIEADRFRFGRCQFRLCPGQVKLPDLTVIKAAFDQVAIVPAQLDRLSK